MYDLSHEIDVYKASLPFMEAAKDMANALQMNDHGPLHAQRVYMNARLLSSIFDLTQYESSLLLAASLLHDIGMAENRKEHHIVAHNLVIELSKSGELPFSDEEAKIVGKLCKWHRKKYDPEEVNDELNVRTGFLASLIRIADSMDLDYRRSPDFFGPRGEVIKKLNEEQVPHHLSVLSILALRLCVNHIGTKLELFVEDFKFASLQIERLIDELLGIKFSWPIQLAPIHQSLPSSSLTTTKKKKAIIFAYCNAHGIISAATTQKQLELQGFEVTTVCNFNTTVSPYYFWENTFQDFNFDVYSSVSLLDLYIHPEQLDKTIEKIQQASHCSWDYASPLAITGIEIQRLTAAGVNIFLCDERALFTGSVLDVDSLFWMRVSGLCNFDNPLMTAGITKDQYDVAMGIRYEIMLSQQEKRADGYYLTLSERIRNNDVDYFKAKAASFGQHIAENQLTGTKHGRVLVFDPNDTNGRSIYDFIYKAIASQGTRPYEENEFETPFAIFPRSQTATSESCSLATSAGWKWPIQSDTF